MPRRCAVTKCGGNGRGASEYTKMVSFPTKDDPEYGRWVEAMPNTRKELESMKEIWVCAAHFRGEWKTVRGGKRPVNPPSVFPPTVEKSCFKQVVSKPRSTKAATSEQRENKQKMLEEAKDKIKNFENFVKGCPGQINKNFQIRRHENDLTVYSMDVLASKVTKFIHFREVKSKFGFLQLIRAEKDGFAVPLALFDLPKNHMVHKWSQIKFICSVIEQHVPSTQDRVRAAIEQLDEIEDLQDSTNLQFILDQLQLLRVSPKARRYTKHTLVFAVELFGISPAAYRMLRRSKAITLPRERMIRDIMDKSTGEENLANLLKSLAPEQRLVNILFDEVKLVSTIRLTGGHVIGMAENDPDDLATHALVFELVCHHGGPRWIQRVVPVSKLKAAQLREMLLEEIQSVKGNGGMPVALIGDNCSVNRGCYKLMGGPGKIDHEGVPLFLIYDYVHIFKNIRNNWYTEVTQQLEFTVDGKTYIAYWEDVVNLYNEDQKTPVRLTKLTKIAINPKPLQRQSVPLVCSVFNDKTVTAFKAMKENKTFKFSEGTVVFIELITKWLKMMNVKDTVSHIKLRDEARAPWTRDCFAFTSLPKICDVISSCKWTGGRGRLWKLTVNTADAFIITTRTVVAASKHILTNYNYTYILPGVWSDDALEKFFGRTRERTSGSFYIDIKDVESAAKVQRTHQLMKYDLMPEHCSTKKCSSCTAPVEGQDLELLNEITIQETQDLIYSDHTLKEKVIYIAGFLVHKHKIDDPSESFSAEFLDSLSRGGLSVPTLNVAFFVHSAMEVHGKLPKIKKHCTKYVIQLLRLIDVPFADDQTICRTLANLLSKAYVLNDSDREKQIGCLRRQEKLADNIKKK